MHKRLIRSFDEITGKTTEEIPGVEIKITQVLNPKRENSFGRDFLVMSTGIIYSRQIYYSNDKNSKWVYLHDDSLTANLSGDRVYLLNSFRHACKDSIHRHLDIYQHLFKNADKTYNLIRKANTVFIEEMTRHYNKFGISIFYGQPKFEPWV